MASVEMECVFFSPLKPSEAAKRTTKCTARSFTADVGPALSWYLTQVFSSMSDCIWCGAALIVHNWGELGFTLLFF